MFRFYRGAWQQALDLALATPGSPREVGVQVEQMEFKPHLDLEFLKSAYGIGGVAVFQQLFWDDGESLYGQVLDAGFTRLGRELTGAEADHIFRSLQRQYGADK